MKVLKFGGTSVGTVESVSAVRQIASQLETEAVIVVSALGGLTDRLIAAARMACAGEVSLENEISEIRSRHILMVEGLFDGQERDEVISKISPLLSQLADVLRGVALIKSLPEETLDIVVSFGERISSLIVASAISGAEHFDSLEIIKTERWFNKNIADTQLTTQLIRETLGQRKSPVAVMGGFISTDRDTGSITNLGRGGSDYTAALVAAALNAESLEIWTDVDGFMTTDPRMIPSARVMEEMSFVESMELCSFGAKVIYPPTIYPVFHKNIPIRILNTFNPSAPGTLITDSPSKDKSPVKGISSLPATSLIKVSGSGIANVADINSRIFNALAKKGVRVILVTQAELDEHIAFVVAASDTDITLDILKDEFAPEIAGGTLTEISAVRGVTTVAVVGENIINDPGIASRITNTLRREGIMPLAVSSATSQTTISFVVEESATRDAIALLHSCFFD